MTHLGTFSGLIALRPPMWLVGELNPALASPHLLRTLYQMKNFPRLPPHPVPVQTPFPFPLRPRHTPYQYKLSLYFPTSSNTSSPLTPYKSLSLALQVYPSPSLYPESHPVPHPPPSPTYLGGGVLEGAHCYQRTEVPLRLPRLLPTRPTQLMEVGQGAVMVVIVLRYQNTSIE